MGFHPAALKTPPHATIPEVEFVTRRAHWLVRSRVWHSGAQVVEVLDWH